jgi:RsiW-degrading membrane proteinase PrsW (M82 family)
VQADPTVAISLALAGGLICVALLRLLDLNEKEPLWALVLFVWLGAVASAAAALLVPADLRRDTALGVALTSQTAIVLAIASGLLVLAQVTRLRGWSEVDDRYDGIIYGAAAGLGFSIGEGLGRVLFAGHSEEQIPGQLTNADVLWMTVQSAALDASLGAILGFGLVVAIRGTGPGRVFGPALAFGVAIAAYAGYAALALDDFQIGPRASAVSILVLIAIAAAAAAAVVRNLRAESDAIRRGLKGEREPVITTKERRLLENWPARHAEYWRMFIRGDLHGWSRLRALQDRQAKLALLNARSAGDRGRGEALRRSIRDRRRSHESALRVSGSMRRWGRGTMGLAATALLVVLGGVAILVAAGGGKPPSTMVTETLLAQRADEAAAEAASGSQVLGDAAAVVGPWRLTAVQRDQPLPGDALESYELVYEPDTDDLSSQGRSPVRQIVTRFASSASAAGYMRGAFGPGADETQRAWQDGASVSVASGGDVDDVDAFCQASRSLLAKLVAAIKASVPTYWTAGRFGDTYYFSDDSAGQILSQIFVSAKPFSGTFAGYSRRNRAERRKAPGYEVLESRYLGFAFGGRLSYHAFQWHRPHQAPVTRTDLVHVDSCHMAYEIVARSILPPEHFQAILDGILAPLLVSPPSQQVGGQT